MFVYEEIENTCEKFINEKDLYVSDLDLTNKEELNDILNVSLKMLNLIEVVIVGYLRSKNLVVHGIVYVSELHKFFKYTYRKLEKKNLIYI